ncbi:MAG: cation transporter [Candidatus Spechtbacteria bacterium]|nr:cation transporter [Candidatus Spechtbacteria bacterium]
MHDHVHNENGRDHTHDHAKASSRGILFGIKVGIGLNMTLFLSHLIVFFFFSGKSIAVLGASLENLAHGTVLIISYTLISLSQRPPTAKYTYGLKRLDAATPVFNAWVLSIIGIFIILEGTKRIINPREVIGWTMMLVAGLDITSNIVQFAVMRTHFRNETIKSIVVHIALDSAASLAVIIGGFMVYQFAFFGADGFAAVAIGLLSIGLALVFVRRSLPVFLARVPRGIHLTKVETYIRNFPGVTDIHELHIWPITHSMNSIDCHIVHAWSPDDADRLREQLRALLHKNFPIHHSVIQCETKKCAIAQEV